MLEDVHTIILTSAFSLIEINVRLTVRIWWTGLPQASMDGFDK